MKASDPKTVSFIAPAVFLLCPREVSFIQNIGNNFHGKCSSFKWSLVTDMKLN
jgi:hypothetical protein